MGCACGKRRGSGTAAKPGELIGYSVTYPNGTSSPEAAPFMTIAEAKAEVRMAGGGTIRKMVRKP
jgi:hypothetical protein